MPFKRIYIGQHLKRLSDPTPLNKMYLERGMVARVEYVTVSGEKNYYWVLVLEPKFKNYFHCLDLNYLKEQIFGKLSNDFKEIMTTTARIKKLELAKLDFIKNSKGVYTSKIKNKLLQEGYRTFLFKNIRSVIVYNYEYPNDLIGSEAERKKESQRKEAELKKLEQKQKNDGKVEPDIILEKKAEEKAKSQKKKQSEKKAKEMPETQKNKQSEKMAEKQKIDKNNIIIDKSK